MIDSTTSDRVTFPRSWEDVWNQTKEEPSNVGSKDKTKHCFENSINSVTAAIENESKGDTQYYLKYCFLPIALGGGLSTFISSSHVKGMIIATGWIVAIAALHLRRQNRIELKDQLTGLQKAKSAL